jgi:hypothetical protein
MSRRDDAIVAWHEVPGRAPPQKIRPVGYGVILAGARTNRSRTSLALHARAKEIAPYPPSRHSALSQIDVNLRFEMDIPRVVTGPV